MNLSVEVAILAGGQSRRMGTDKSTLFLNGKSLLECVQANAAPLGLTTQVIEKDVVPTCGPLGGIITAFRSTTAGALLFLSVDMPFVPLSFLKKFLARFAEQGNAQFTLIDERPGFPFLLPQGCLTVAEKLHQEKIFALHKLAAELDADFVKVSGAMADDFLNINTPEDWEKAVAFSKYRG
jgi:molybdopterin-guanine dinucleotide biosynthesis protein A